ncbi:MAG: NAD(P)/FAD-dependent oxidoreductase [Acidobacteriota bacterium]|nr:NAD(P)/FAD-dependent oxidoreductase [Acidobacteriota bacterium]
MKFDVIIIGAGAAGLFCAVEAGKRGRKVLVVEHNAQVGRKILISGGGRCNFTNIHTKAENFISKNPHFCKSALARYTPQDFVELVKKHNIAFYEKKLGQLFCRESSRQIVEMLLAECAKAKVEIREGCSVKKVEKKVGESGGNCFEIETNQGSFVTESLVIATGGLSFPKIGATDFGLKIARQFGLKIIEPQPALVPLVFEKNTKNFGQLAGVSVDAVVSTGNQAFRENILFTHRGLSGPAILQISNYWRKDETISINLTPNEDALEILERNQTNKQNLDNFLSRFLPNRFAEIFTAESFPNKPINQIGARERERIAENLNGWQVKFVETEGFHKAEVTRGGVSTDELSSQTMEAKKCAGLYFIGEVADVTGWLGGYNFQWAWASGFAAAQAV